jgi:ribosomal protein S18 acetylase RimI-like enzyme
MNIRSAKPHDIPEVMDLIRSCVRHMESQGILQWDEIYPDETSFANDSERHELYLLEDGNRIRGVMTLNESQEPAYQEVAWHFKGNTLVVHRLAVDPSSQGKGLAEELMQFAYEVAGKYQYATIRLNAFANNPRAVALYERLGYRRAGTVMFRKGPFYCFEIQVV